ncbi:MAG: hypothetical protein FWF42_01560 [Streptococcaceae bacterium]|nr:hypothetical protein [Streptococcaceae bacterium]MCL2681007.1 hypothetical protein [Streptococcaceae bacterium]MCL2858355.1 hypothetical protein [Streptococcaceae bacterium]
MDNKPLFPYATFCTLIYVIFGVFFHAWDRAWVIYLTIPIFMYFAKNYRNKK